MRFAWIQRHVTEFEVSMMCRMLQVSRGGYYAWVCRSPSEQALRRQQIIQQMKQSHHACRGIYGSPRLHAELADQGIKVCLNTVAKYMRQEQMASRIKQGRYVLTTDSRHQYAPAANVLERDFVATGPDQKWCCDITYIPTSEGFLYVSAVLDLYSRKIVGWSMADHLRAELCMEALGMALQQRSPVAGLIHHSDRGVQYACDAYLQRLEDHGIIASMSRRGDCWDNAMMESFWGSLKSEWSAHERYATLAEARSSVFWYIEVFYNRQRRHSAIGYVSPEAFEASLN